jgi:hypothetical protein
VALRLLVHQHHSLLHFTCTKQNHTVRSSSTSKQAVILIITIIRRLNRHVVIHEGHMASSNIALIYSGFRSTWVFQPCLA